MADGTHRPMAELRVGDEIYGTVRDQPGGPRRYVTTTVRDRWSSIKPAWRVTLTDGRVLIASADHRFLSHAGWKHVFGAEHGGPLRRPHLTPGLPLLGTGRFVDGPSFTREYRRGYLTGLARADADLSSDVYERSGDRRFTANRLRLVLADDEALRSARRCLSEEGVAMPRARFAARAGTGRATRAIRTPARPGGERARELVDWPLSPSNDWRKGFLAGVFDAEGATPPGHVARIANGNPALGAWIEACLRLFGFRARANRPGDHGLEYIRLRGGLPERLRFLQLTEPAITGRRSIQGMAVENPDPPRVAAVEPTGVAMRLYDITTGTGDFIANGVVSHNCFARPTHTYLDFDAGRDFEREIVVKVNTPELARAELTKPSWKREHVALGTNTDPYQWVEKKYELLPGVWEAMRDSRTPSSVLTKSPLLLRDIELFKQIPSFAANLSIPTLDEEAWRASEPHTPHPRKRIEAVAELNRAGIPCGVLIAPLMPGINDSPEQVEEILRLCGEAGAVSIGGICLHLRGEVRGIYMDWLRSYRPDLVPRYERLYARGAYAPPAERERISQIVRQGRRVMPTARASPNRTGHEDAIAHDAAIDAEHPPMAEPPPEQPSLF